MVMDAILRVVPSGVDEVSKMDEGTQVQVYYSLEVVGMISVP